MKNSIVHNSTALGFNSFVLPFPDLMSRHKKRKKKGKKDISTEVSLQLERQMIKKRVVKYSDSSWIGFSATSSVVSEIITDSIPQGPAQGQRIGDTVFVHGMDIRMNIVTANADIFNLARFVWFIWWQNTVGVSPGSTSVIENASAYGIYSHYNFEGRENFSLLKDVVFNMTGTASSPTPNSQHTFVCRFPLNNHRIDYNFGVTSATGHLYFLDYSDSSVAPWPDYNLVTRVWFSDD